MPRHPSLVPYSHDHHHALVIVLRIKKEGPTSPNDFGWPSEFWEHAERSLEYFESELEEHFRKEETELFPELRRLLADSAILDDLLTEHQELRKSREEIRAEISERNESVVRLELKKIGVLLEAHVRKEERVLFPTVEKEL
jgi:iron-sulfur cluster repair protein YtfE (RIC family)